MTLPKNRRAIAALSVALGLWLLVPVCGLRWLGARRSLSALRAQAVPAEAPPETVEPLDWIDLPMDRGTTCAPLALRLTRICAEAEIDSFVYEVRLAESVAVDPLIGSYLSSHAPLDGARGSTAVALRSQRAFLTGRVGYTGLRRFLDQVAAANPPLSIRSLEVRAADADLRIEVELLSLCLEM
jgi:hypothetical protein